MQLQNPFSNFSDETKQNDSDNDNNPINIINFQNSPKEHKLDQHLFLP